MTPSPKRLARPGGQSIAYHRTPGRAPGIVFLGGFMSDMSGTKAQALERYAVARGQAYLRFDYQGHGVSSGRFEEGTIGLWAADAVAALDGASEGPQILVGSSMGGWIMLLVALARPERVAGLVGIASAPDFTEELIWGEMDAEQRAELAARGVVYQPSDYDEQPYAITQALIDEGRDHLLLGSEIPLDCPVRLIHGMADQDVPWQVSLRLAQRVRSADVELTLVKAGAHRLSEPDDMARLERMLDALLAGLSSGNRAI